MNPRLRAKLFSTAAVAVLVVTVGGMALAHPVGFGFPNCGPSASDSSDPSGGPGPEPSASCEPSPGDSGSGSTTPEPTTGAIAGSIRNSTGGPLAGSTVAASATESPGGFFSTTTDKNGHYVLTGLPVSHYVVSFTIPGTSLLQYMYGKINYSDAHVIAVKAGQTTTVNDKAMATGTITGHLRTRSGAPVALASVSGSSSNGGYGFTTTDNSGAFSFAVFPGTYVVGFTLSSGTHQFAYQQVDVAKAATFPVAAGATVVVDDTILPSGRVAGRLVENDGKPAAHAQVFLSGIDVPESLSTTTGSDGVYHLDFIPPGHYTVQFTSADFSRGQWAYHTIDRRKATAVKVQVDQTTTVNDRFLPTGSVKVVATDATTGQPIPDFCFGAQPNFSNNYACSNGTGQATLTNLPVGDTYEIDVNTLSDTYLGAVVQNVKVTDGGTTTLQVAVARAAIVETTAVDARTHQPVPNVCVTPWVPKTGPTGAGACSDSTGKVRLSLKAGSYTLLAQPQDNVHGLQWVGTSGGTGSQYTARHLILSAGQQVTLPPIALDPAGKISGTVTDKATGQPVPFACVATVPVHAAFAHAGECPYGGFTDGQGRYTINGLGPYSWPVEFATGDKYAWQWSGGVASRNLATPVRVTAGQTATSSAKLSTGTVVSGTVSAPDGQPLPSFVVAVNSDTGDAAGGLTDDGGKYAVPVLPQTIRLTYRDVDFAYGEMWYQNARDFDHATQVPVGSSPLTINLVAF
jgi:hypothetical protein